MFHEQNVANFHKSVVSTPKVYTVFYGTVRNTFLWLVWKPLELFIWKSGCFDDGLQYEVENNIMCCDSSGVSQKSGVLIVRYSQKKKNCFLLFRESFKTLEPLARFRLQSNRKFKMSHVQLPTDSPRSHMNKSEHAPLWNLNMHLYDEMRMTSCDVCVLPIIRQKIKHPRLFPVACPHFTFFATNYCIYNFILFQKS